jgi:regulator of sigma E protease
LIEVIQGFGTLVFSYLLPFLFILALVVFVHELGHFLVARWLGVAVRVFSLGFGPELVGFTDRRGTRWRLSAIPLGGYVKFLGDENVASASGPESVSKLSPADRAAAFASASVGRRAAIVAAGPMANFLLAILIFTILAAISGRTVIVPEVHAVQPNSPAAEAGFQPGDLIVAVNGGRIDSYIDLQRIVGMNGGHQLLITVNRDGTELTLPVTPRRDVVVDERGNTYPRGLIGIERAPTAEVVVQHYSLPGALWRGVQDTWFILDTSVRYLFRLASGTESIDQLAGPIAIAQFSGEAAALGFLNLMLWAALVSASIGFVNLLPIPLLDGGHLLYYCYEAVRGRPLSERVQEVGFRIGLVLILMLIAVALTNDIGRLFA